MLYPEHVFLKQTNRVHCCTSLFREKLKEGGGNWWAQPRLVLTPFSSTLPPARYIGCYVDNTRRRTLRGVSFFDYKKMTVFRCQDNCAER